LSQWGSDEDERPPNIPKLYSVPAKSLINNMIVVEEEPGLCESWMGKHCVWLVKERKTECGAHVVVEEEPGLCKSWMGKHCVWLVKERKTECEAHVFHPCLQNFLALPAKPQ
jgi:hypothetical protein